MNKYNIGNEIWFWYIGEIAHGIIHEILGEKYNAIWYGVTLLDGITNVLLQNNIVGLLKRKC